MKKLLKTSIAVMLCVLSLLSFSGCEKDKRDYEFTTEKPSKTMVPVASPGYSDLYTTDLDSIKKMSGMIYRGENFGEIQTEDAAVKAAATVVTDIYGNSFDGYEPLVCVFNERAGCWIVHGTPKDNRNSGVCFVAIRKADGSVAMVLKNKK